MRRLLLLATLLVCAGPALQLLGVPVPGMVTAASFQVSPASSTIDIGQSVQLITVGQKAGVRWSSSNTTIAAVSGSGVVTGKAAGQVTISARSSNLFASASVAVSQFIIHIPALTTNSTTPGTVTLSATLNAIDVRAAYTNDLNGNGTATVQYQKHTGDTGYHTAYVPYIDRRATLGAVPLANPYVKQARVSIVGLLENTSYDVRVTWADVDGVATQSTVATTSTLTTSPPTGGSTINVTNNTNLATALSTVNAGQTISFASATYNAFSLSRSGNSGAWIVLDGGGVATITGLGVAQNISLSANYIVLKNFILSASDSSGIVISGGGLHDIIIQSNTLQNISRLCTNDATTGGTGSHYADSGIYAGASSSNIIVKSNSVTSTSLASCIHTDVLFDSPTTGISLADCTTCVFDSNTVTGAFRDGVSADNSTIATINVDMSNNTVTDYVDDGIESKGDNINVRLWGNVITSSRGSTCIAGNTNTDTNQYGPLYIFRNSCRITGSLTVGGGDVYKLGPAAPTFVFHNSIDTSGLSPTWDTYAGATGPFVYYNNVAKSSGSMIVNAPTTTLTDYNVGSAGSSWGYLWGGTTTYSTLSDFQAGTGQEAHGVSADPLFSGTDLHLQAGSPALDIGVLLNNFNTSDSAWPLVGSAPDVGFWEKP